jgi:hypothetical protein
MLKLPEIKKSPAVDLYLSDSQPSQSVKKTKRYSSAKHKKRKTESELKISIL